jgi:sugar (pentulose or hexulose) kinase
VAPITSPARGAVSSLAKLLWLRSRVAALPVIYGLHQADWIVGRLTGRFGVSDWNNCLKLGYDPEREDWPDWIGKLDLGPIRLPRVEAPGTVVGALRPESAAITGLPESTLVVLGTTDSTAAVLATGVAEIGDAVTCLGSSLVLKILSNAAIAAPEYGVYSHRFGELWLVGGASNTGGAVLKQYFDDNQIAHLTRRLRPDQPTGLDYYPLPAPGERFPINDPRMPPRLEPRPADDLRFFQGLLEGIAQIEAAGYRLLAKLGAPAPVRVVSTGGGAQNPGWTMIRGRRLGVPVTPAETQEAAYGSALLALRISGRTGASSTGCTTSGG